MKTALLCCLFMLLPLRLFAFDIGATTQASPEVPDTVVLGELVNLYQPVPFDHKSHAQMTEMSEGCITCHHRPPTTQSVHAVPSDAHDQSDSDRIPACKSCHEIAAEQANIHMPTLKGAYHRQCLNCHREWANEKSCTACHLARNEIGSAQTASRDDIVGRMHPPIPQPDVKQFTARFTPAVGSNVLFRHLEHSTKYGLKCVNCHRRDSCSTCHNGSSNGPRLLNPGRTWAEAHGTCMACHQNDRCQTCHFNDGQTPPPPFEHQMVGQVLDKDHATLKCGQCHPVLKARKVVTCGDASCHKAELAVEYPAKRPGPMLIVAPPATMPSTRPAVQVQVEPSGTVIKRVRRGPSTGGS